MAFSSSRMSAWEVRASTAEDAPAVGDVVEVDVNAEVELDFDNSVAPWFPFFSEPLASVLFLFFPLEVPSVRAMSDLELEVGRCRTTGRYSQSRSLAVFRPFLGLLLPADQ